MYYDSMSGIIYVCGLYGAGKSTLIRAALHSVEALQSLPTHVTRPPRPGELEDAKLNVRFVTKDEYEQIRAGRSSWDHTEIAGTWYGADASAINADIRAGKTFIIASPNTVDKLREMQRNYVGSGVVIWIDTDIAACNARLLARDGEKAKKRVADSAQSEEEATRMREVADIVFKPTGDLVADGHRFVELVSELMHA